MQRHCLFRLECLAKDPVSGVSALARQFKVTMALKIKETQLTTSLPSCRPEHKVMSPTNSIVGRRSLPRPTEPPT